MNALMIPPPTVQPGPPPNRHAISCIAGFALAGLIGLGTAKAEVRLERTPNSGIQPQAARDDAGTLHLVYFEGDARAGDLRYVTRPAGAASFTAPRPVNATPSSAVAVGTIRGAQIALGPESQVHVLWNGSQKVTSGDPASTPLLYTRLLPDREGFEPERNLITHAAGLDGGSSVAADQQGGVYVLWHAPGALPGEAHRQVFLARSTDGGRTFAREVPISPAASGACGCCGLKALADDHGPLYVLFRAAQNGSHRDAMLLVSQGGEHAFKVLWTDPWESFTCPMSSAGLAQVRNGIVACWETQRQVFFRTVALRSNKLGSVHSPPGEGSRKHPVAVNNFRGETLLAWTEGTGWEKGGRVAWQVFDSEGNPMPEAGSKDGVPVWGLITAVAESDGDFTLIY